jgi:hypothetical protein
MLHARRLLARYERVNAAHPIKVRGGVGIGLFFIGDVLAQRIGHDPARRLPTPPPPLPAPHQLESPATAEQRQRLQTYPQRDAPADRDRIVVLPTQPIPRPAATAVSSAVWSYHDWDVQRTLRSCSWRAVVWAPSAHYFWMVRPLPFVAPHFYLVLSF